MREEIIARIQSDLLEMGIKPGVPLLVHSALNSMDFPPLDNRRERAAWVTEALIGASSPRLPGGCLLMPALTYRYVTHEEPYFSVRETPSCVGGLTEYFRLRKDTIRSLHPTHSVSAMGDRAEWFIGEHRLDETPVGPHSPFAKLKEARGKVLMLGCSLNKNTSFHGVEETEEPPYLLGDEVEYTLKDGEGRITHKKYRTHAFRGVDQNYVRVLDVLDGDDYQRGFVLGAECFLIDSRALWRKGAEKLRKDPFFFVVPAE